MPRCDESTLVQACKGSVLGACGLIACMLTVGAGDASGQACVPVLRTLDVSSNPPGQGSTANSIAAIGNRAAIQVNSASRAYVWDGGRAGSAPLINAPMLQFLTPNWFVGTFGSSFYFTASTRLYRCDLDGTNPVSLLGASGGGLPITIVPSESFQLSPIGSQLLFAGVENGAGPELAITDGTSAGTRVLVDINPGSLGSNPQRFMALGSKVFFFAQTQAAGVEPWITDGTTAGTMMLADIEPGGRNSIGFNSDGSTIGTATVFNDQVFFLVSRVVSTGSTAMYRTDGTPGGTVQVDLGGVVPRGYLATITGGVLFVGNTTPTGDELYFTDGTPGGTRLVKDVTPLSGGTQFSFIRSRGDRAFFGASTDSGRSRNLYVTDGTASGTFALPSVLPPGSTAPLIRPGPIVRGKFVFAMVSAPNSRLGVSDGTPGGTCAVPGALTTFFEYADGRGLVNAATNSRAFVMGIDATYGNEPRVVDLCPADFNNSGGEPNVQDVYDFLSAFFAGSVDADVNASGGSPTVQDVFDFIAAWYVGCP